MDTQNELFDEELSDKLKKDGMEAAANNRSDLLALAREVAIDIALKGNGTCHADSVGRVLKKQYGIDSLGPATGSLFKTPNWLFTGQWKKSTRITNHSRYIRVWKLI